MKLLGIFITKDENRPHKPPALEYKSCATKQNAQKQSHEVPTHPASSADGDWAGVNGKLDAASVQHREKSEIQLVD